jgi:hypothetical protein
MTGFGGKAGFDHGQAYGLRLISTQFKQWFVGHKLQPDLQRLQKGFT